MKKKYRMPIRFYFLPASWSIRFLGLGLAMLFAFTPFGVTAQGNLLVTPRRVIFEKSTRVQELTLANIGKDTARYLISIMEIKMNENGSFEQITTPDSGQQFASKYLRIYPRNVNVAPGESQLVKVQLVKTDQLNPGEYRSHIYVRAVPVENPLGDKETKRDTGDISVKLTAIFGLSIPALVRVGENDTRITLSEAAFFIAPDKKPKLSVTLNRSGLMSSYGDMSVDCIKSNGETKQVGIVRGIAVYTPNTRRNFQLALDVVPGFDYKNCKLVIRYMTQKDSKVQDQAETELTLN